MSTAVNLADPTGAAHVLGLMARRHEEAGMVYDDAHREAVIEPLLHGSPLGAVWLIGPQRAPLGYVLVTFGWSVAHGGMVGWLSDMFIRPSVRNRGIGTEVLHGVSVSLKQAGMKAMHVHVAEGDDASARFCARAGFQRDEMQRLMTDLL